MASDLRPDALDTRPDERDDVAQPRLGVRGMLRWAWRQLTSMRTALFLLLLLAVGAVPGSIWPQRSIDAGRVADYLASHSTTGPWLDRLGFFDVYSAPWFAAIYLLLFASLVGCVLPRTRLHWRALRAHPPRPPQRLQRLPEHGAVEVAASVEQAAAVAERVLRARRFRVHVQEPGTVSAENGYLRETGNLVFHAALILVLVAVAVGHLVGWRGDRIVPVGQSLSSSISGYDTMDPGPWVDPERLQPFSVKVDRLDVTFEEHSTGAQRGAPRDFTAYTTTRATPDAAPRQQVLKVNAPLSFGGASVFLLGNGYAPVITVRDAHGSVLYRQATPFLARDNNYTSVGAVKVVAATPKQLGLTGAFFPTAVFDNGRFRSVFPAPKLPTLVLGAFEGTLFPGGRPQSVYTLDTSAMRQVVGPDGKGALLVLEPGQTAQLPGGRGSVTFERLERFAGLSVRYDPGKGLALWGALLALAGLVASLTVRRRRVFVRVTPVREDGIGGDRTASTRGPRSLVTVGGLAKGEDARLAATVQGALDAIVERTGGVAS